MARQVPGRVTVAPGSIVINEGLESVALRVENRGREPIAVGSWYHFAEVNLLLQFDRLRARGLRLDIPSGEMEVFEPGDTAEVQLVPLRGGPRNATAASRRL